MHIAMTAKAVRCRPRSRRSGPLLVGAAQSSPALAARDKLCLLEKAVLRAGCAQSRVRGRIAVATTLLMVLQLLPPLRKNRRDRAFLRGPFEKADSTEMLTSRSHARDNSAGGQPERVVRFRVAVRRKHRNISLARRVKPF